MEIPNLSAQVYILLIQQTRYEVALCLAGSGLAELGEVHERGTPLELGTAVLVEVEENFEEFCAHLALVDSLQRHQMLAPVS